MTSNPTFSSSSSCNALIRHYARSGNVKKALLLFDQFLCKTPFFPDKFTFVNILSACCKEKLIKTGKCIHAIAVIMNLESDIMLATSIINMYGKCGHLEDAQKPFEDLDIKDVISWNAMIATYAKHGYEAQCFKLFDEMHQNCLFADKFTFVSMLSACGNVDNLRHGQYMHVILSHFCHEKEVIIGTALLDMYSKCCSIEDARKVFDLMHNRDITSWNAMISGYSHSCHTRDAFYLFYEMMLKGIVPNKVTFVCLVDVCTISKSLLEAWEIHSHLIEEGFEMDVVLGSSLVNMYCKCYSLNDAHRTFDILPERNLISWNSMIAGCVANQHEEEAFKIFGAMRSEGIINPDSVTYTTLLEACAKLETFFEGEQIFNLALQNGLGIDSSVAASAIKLYGKCDKVEKAFTVFEKIPRKSTEVWNAMLAVYAQHGLLKESCELFHVMYTSGEHPNNFSFIDVLTACGRQRCVREGKWIHLNAVLHAFDKDVFVLNALIDMYGKCCSLEDFCALFDGMLERNSVTWTIMLSAYIHSGHVTDAIQLFHLMKKKNVYLDIVTFVHILDACTNREVLSEGRNIHAGIILRGFDSDIFLVNALINMYVKCRSFDDSTWVFENMHYRDIVSWNTIISAYAQQSKLVEILKCFNQMTLEKIIPDEFTYVSMLAACASPENFNKEAEMLFNEMLERNGVSWSAMIQAYTNQGKNLEALKLFEQMQVEGNVLDGVGIIIRSFNSFSRC